MPTADERKGISDRYLPAELPIIAKHFSVPIPLIREGNDREDRAEATDLVLPCGVRIAKRARQPHQLRFSGDVIFRHPPLHYHQTEWEKILGGAADYCLYSIAKNETELAAWWILDLEALRFNERQGWLCCTPPRYQPIGEDDGIIIVQLDGFPSRPPLVVASSEMSLGSTDDCCSRCKEIAFDRLLEGNLIR